MNQKYRFKIYLPALILISLLAACSGGSKEEHSQSTMNTASANSEEYIRLVQDKHKVDVLIDRELFTSYLYPGTLKKPVLYPINSAQGTPITRGYPLDPRPGERVDHPHHIGLWLNYGDVNGLDFWNNSSAKPAEEKEKYGTIVHKEITHMSSGNDKGVLEVMMEWQNPKGEPLLRENTSFIFRGTEDKRIIDRITTLTALEKEVSLKDNKEGMLGLRVARELEHPTDEPALLVDENGKPASEPSVNNRGVSGMYKSSEGIEGNAVWGTRGKWMNLSGTIDGEKISVAILDHPENVGYPTYWHARGYGLFAANPLGQKALSGGKEELDFKLSPGDSVTFRHRIIVYSVEEVTDDRLEKDFQEFK